MAEKHQAIQPMRILFSNLGYGRGIDGSLMSHIRLLHRHIYCSLSVQEMIISQIASLIEKENPDICCFVEIDSGSLISANFNQMTALANEQYAHFDIENKYGLRSWLRKFVFTRGKSNAFLSKIPLKHERIFLDKGAKRLLYKIEIAENLTLLFGHFSLNRSVRKQQLSQTHKLIAACKSEVVFMGDFNILSGFSELEELLADNRLIVMNRDDIPTFRFHTRHQVLDLCLCTSGIAKQARLKIIPQPYSDHAALLLEL